MISFSVQATPETVRKLKKLEKETPRAMVTAFGRAASASMRMLVSAVKSGGGKYGIQKFPAKTDFTREMERIDKRMPNWFGSIGVRPQLNRWRNGSGEQKIGFIDAVADWAADLQESERRAMTDGQISHFKSKGVTDYPTFYDRPSRNVIDSFSDYLIGGVYSDMVASIAQKILDGKMSAWDGKRSGGGSSSRRRNPSKGKAGGGNHRGFYDHKNFRYV